MTTTMLYTGLVGDRAARRRAGLPAAARQLIARLLRDWRQRSMTRSPAQKARLEAANLRAFAHAREKTEPGFAADLYAAADRHEIENDA